MVEGEYDSMPVWQVTLKPFLPLGIYYCRCYRCYRTNPVKMSWQFELAAIGCAPVLAALEELKARLNRRRLALAVFSFSQERKQPKPKSKLLTISSIPFFWQKKTITIT